MGGVAERIGEAVTAAEARQELARVLESPQFARSEKLQRFLRYVCEKTLEGEGAKINEYLVGEEVFDRGPDYSPTEDGVVRRQAHALRKKLQEYYEHEGRASAVRIELPVGRYVPVFRGLEAAPEVAKPRRAWGRAAALSAAGVALFALGWAGRTWTERPVVEPLPASVREIWGGWLADPNGAVICFSNPMSAVIKHMTEMPGDGAHPPRMPLTDEQERLFRSVVGGPAGGRLYFAPALSQAKMGEALGAIRLAALFAQSGARVEATQSRFLTWEDLMQENYILLGHNEANSWLDKVLEKYPFRLRAMQGGKERSIVTDEGKEYRIQYGEESPARAEEYALISMTAGVDGRRRMAVLSGLNTQATLVAARYLTSADTAGELLGRLRQLSPGHRGEWRFQAILRTEVHDKVPTKVQLEAVRVIAGQ